MGSNWSKRPGGKVKPPAPVNEMPADVAVKVGIDAINRLMLQVRGQEGELLGMGVPVRQLTAEQRAARAKYDELLQAKVILIGLRSDLKEGRILQDVQKGGNGD